ncbi:winged helix-turn-helix transcriptional regulator [Hymenobacter cellulosilyticus]|uniref:Helix-turn-helix transcriptional regulator n=1 Tax=Hymenobacter cellulosilyticus TaxID=2932248 RepID=A0A8T9QAT3_9BACT|nr:helix-turn-helix domain-containing protein [Hymenobacter cellulosilyticus]UOQ74122.1 helix-turn-helix transcriptional regulator [Hymenobacter cellulosilyticus]
MSPHEDFQTRRKHLMRTVQDAMDVLNGKWKIAIIASLCCFTKRRFSDILNDVVGISNRMLSKELKELEINQVIKRSVLNTQPVTVHYELTEHGKTLQPLIEGLADWGVIHHKQIVGT